MCSVNRLVAVLLLVTLSAVAAEDVCDGPDDPTCSPADETMSLLQKKATKRVSTKDTDFDASPDFESVSTLISQTCEKQCAGTLCFDPRTGSNQQLSCMQTCTMRMRGQSQKTCEGQCDRKGNSGCSLTATGFTAHMCGDCHDFAGASEEKEHSFYSNADCYQGCRVETACDKQCAGTLCADPSTGSHQLLSCSQSCTMRMRGESQQTCSGQCDRKGNSGCALTASGFTARMCGDCQDFAGATEAKKHAFLSNDDCYQGCDVGKLSPCEKQCYGTVCQNPSQGMNQQLSCMQSCEMRMHGEGEVECGYKCHRNGGSGCSLTASGYTASMCGYCSDWKASTKGQQDSFYSNQDCLKGCQYQDQDQDQHAGLQ